MVYLFRWELHVSPANVEKVTSSDCCSTTQENSGFGLTLNPPLLSDRLRQQNRPRFFLPSAVIPHFLFAVRTNRKQEFSKFHLPTLPHTWTVRRLLSHLCDRADKLLTFKDQLSLIHFLHLPHIRLSSVTISGRCQPRGTLGN